MTTTGVRHSVRSALLQCRGAERKVLCLTQAIGLNIRRRTIVLRTQSSLMLVAQDRSNQSSLTSCKRKKRARTHREREVERKTVRHRLSDCLCTCAGESFDPFGTDWCSVA